MVRLVPSWVPTVRKCCACARLEENHILGLLLRKKLSDSLTLSHYFVVFANEREKKGVGVGVREERETRRDRQTDG